MMRLAVVCDYREENWPSMDLAADELLAEIRRSSGGAVEASCIRPALRRRWSRLPVFGSGRFCRNADRLMNRFLDYPRHLEGREREADFFHVADHSYAHLVHSLPEGRTGVFCHDLDAFRCLLEPALHPRPFWFKAFTRRILAGLEKASVVFHSTMAVRAEIGKFGLLDPGRLVHAPYGVAEAFSASGPKVGEPGGMAGTGGRAPFLLHVGSCIPRKRIDILLQVFAELHRRRPELRLIHVGAPWEESQSVLIGRLGIAASVSHFSRVADHDLASLYRSAALVMIPSSAEGFSLPLAEALACGGLVVASDIPVLREVGGEAAVFCPVGEVEEWSRTAESLLEHPEAAPPPEVRTEVGQGYSWARHAETIIEAYERL